MQAENLKELHENIARNLRSALEAIKPSLEARLKEPGAQVLEQNGFTNGLDIVEEFLRETEYQLALEHMCYIVEEWEVAISEEAYDALDAAGRAMELDPNVWVGCRQHVRRG